MSFETMVASPARQWAEADDLALMTATDIMASRDAKELYYETLDAWRQDVITLASIKEREMRLRLLLVNLTFTDPTEGTNTHLFGDNRKAAKLTMTQPISRKVDPAAIKQCLDELRKTRGDAVDELIRWKPDLAVTEYKALTPEEQAILAPAITSAPGTPQLKFVAAKV